MFLTTRTAPSMAAIEDLVAWKSSVGVQVSSDKRTVRSTAKGWGRSGAITEALITRSSDVEGFLATLPQSNTTLFIGLTNLEKSLYDTSRAHQEDLEFALRISADGTLSYFSRERATAVYHAVQMESDVLGVVDQGDAVGMRLSADRRGFSVVLLKKAAALSVSPLPGSTPGLESKQHFTVLKYFNEVMSFPLKLLVVFGSSKTELGPVCWLRGKPQKAEQNLKGPADFAAVAAGSTGPTVKGRHAGDLLGAGALDGKGGMLVLQAAEAGSWAAGTVSRVGGKTIAEQVPDLFAAAKLSGVELQKQAREKAEAKAKAKEDKAKAGAARMAALQPKAVARGARLVPQSVKSKTALLPQSIRPKAPMHSKGTGSASVGGVAVKPLAASDKAEGIEAVLPARLGPELGHAQSQPLEWMRLGSGLKPEPEWAEGEGGEEEEDAEGGTWAEGGWSGGALPKETADEMAERAAAEAAMAAAAAAEEELRRSRVPLGPTEWLQVWVAQRSPFSSAAERAALADLTESDPFITYDQLRLLSAAIDRLMPRSTSDLDPLSSADFDEIGERKRRQPPPPPPPVILPLTMANVDVVDGGEGSLPAQIERAVFLSPSDPTLAVLSREPQKARAHASAPRCT